MASTVEMRAILRDEITAGLKGIEAELKKVGSEGRAAGAGLSSGMSSALPTVSGVTDALGKQVAQLRAQRDAMKTADYQKFAEQQKAIKAEIEAMTAPQQKAERNWMSIGTAVKGFMALQVVGYLKDATMAIYEATAEMDSLKRGLTAVMGSSSAAAAEMERLKEVAKLPGLGYQEAIRMSTSLQAAGMSAGMARNAMMAFGNALATVGKGKADLDGVGLALSQIMSKGKVSAEEINQIAERVPQIRVAMESAFGTASTEMIQKMGMTSGQFIRGVTDELGKLEKVTGGLRNGTENLSDAWFQFKATLGGTGSIFSEIANDAASMLSVVSSAINKINSLANQKKIASAKAMKEETEELIRNGKFIDSYRQREYNAAMVILNKALAERKKEIAAELAEKNKLTDGQKDLERQFLSYKKTAGADALKAEELMNTKRIKDAAGNKASLEQAEFIHQRRLQEIKEDAEKNAKKKTKKKKTKKEPKPDISYSTHVVLSDPPDVVAARRKQNEDDMRALRVTSKAKNDAAKEERDDWKELIELARKGKEERLKNDADIAKEQRKRSKEEREEFESSMAARLGMHNATITAMLKGETSLTDGMRTMWDNTGTAIINKLLEVAETWIAEQTAMLVFGTGVKAEEVATSAVAGAAMTAAYAPAAASASIASFGGAAAAGLSSMAATVPAMMAMFSYADRGGSTLVGQNRLVVGENRPEEFRRTVPGNIHNTTTNYGAVNVTIQGGGDAKAIAREIVRAQRTAGANNYGGSH